MGRRDKPENIFMNEAVEARWSNGIWYGARVVSLKPGSQMKMEALTKITSI